MGYGSITVTPNPGNALSAFVTVCSNRAVTVSVTARAPGHEVTLPRTARLSLLYELDLVGLRPCTSYLVSAEGYLPDGTAFGLGCPVRLRSGPVPPDFPFLSVTADPARMAPGLTLFNLVPWQLPSAGRPIVPLSLSVQPMLGYLLA